MLGRKARSETEGLRSLHQMSSHETLRFFTSHEMLDAPFFSAHQNRSRRLLFPFLFISQNNANPPTQRQPFRLLTTSPNICED